MLQYMAFCDCLLSAYVLRFIHVVAYSSIHSFCSWIIFQLYIYQILFIHSLVDEPSGLLLLLDVINDVAMNICMNIFSWIYVFNFLGYIPNIGISGPYDTSMLSFWETAKLSLKWLYCFIFPPTRNFQFLHILANTCYCFSLW